MKPTGAKPSNTFSEKLKPYSWYKCGREDISWNEYQFERFIYRFDTRLGEKYLVYAEFFKYEVVALKFFLRRMKSNRNKFKFRTHKGDAFRILATVLDIAYSISLSHPHVSFAFIGENDKGETRNYTKRFKVYERYAKAFFSPDNFDHRINVQLSSYLLLNKKSAIIEKEEEVYHMFSELYAMVVAQEDNAQL